MAYLTWITNEKLIACTEHLLSVSEDAVQGTENKKKFHKNVIDPFSAFFQIAGFNIDYQNWLSAERKRQAQKTLQNHVGSFHQKILGQVEGWENMGKGGYMDLKSDQKRIIAEVKNKFHTVKGSALVNVYNNLDNLVMPKSSIYHGFTSYVVDIIPKRPNRANIPFIPSDRDTGGKKPLNELIRRIDGASFYHLVTGEENALQELFIILPKVVSNLRNREISEEDRKSLELLFQMAYGE